MERIGAIEPGTLVPVEPAERREGAGFASALGDAIQSLDAAQLEADAAARTLANGGGNLHETALALEKADISMRVATKVRNKVIDAYQEIMRMSV